MSELGIFYPEKGYKKITENYTGTLGTIITTENFEEMANKIDKGVGKLKFKVTMEGETQTILINLHAFPNDQIPSILGSISIPYVTAWACANYFGEYQNEGYSCITQMFFYQLSETSQITNLSNLISSSTECTLDITYYE